MAEKRKDQVNEMLPDDSFQDNGLTRIHPDTRFVIEQKSGLIMFIYKVQDEFLMLQDLLRHKIVPDPGKLKKNRYGDILIIN